MEEDRLVIDTLKNCISDLLASGNIDQKELASTLTTLEKKRDSYIINNVETNIDKLIEDIKYIKYDLL